ncbi:hypothetical protein [Paenibacillus agilis]|uniref:DUF5050 domain-containing protein n=1 Tax=Paenibacillus agilis TaxID=3020863 RepID=A0A559IKW4_9BACL|nr:hypothetical protein [Paenibacillus agilis]TVX88123.1 hypothetical protein FPZ44_19645 [Paenibacillus agilis]
MKLVFALAVMFLMSSCTSSSSGEKEKLKGTSPHAVVYYSTDLPNERIGDGLSYLFLIDREGKLTKIKKRGLELNSIIPFGQLLLLNQKEQLLTIQKDGNIQSASYKKDCTVPAGYGQSSGKLYDGKLYYSIFNGRFSEDMKYYISKIRWGTESQHYCQDIKAYIETTGDDGNHIYFLSSDIADPAKKSFHKLSIQGARMTHHQSFLEKSQAKGRFMFTKLVEHGNDMIGIYADLVGNKVELNLMQIHKDNKVPFKKHPLIQYEGDNSHYYFFNKDSMYVHNEQVYFVDGYGDVYVYHLQQKKLEKKFHLKDYKRESRLQDEMVYFRNGHLYFYRFNEKVKSHQIETYNLQGDLKTTLLLPDLKKELGRDSVFLYDFKVVRP